MEDLRNLKRDLLRDQENCKTYFDDYIMNGKLSTCCLLRLSDYSMYFDMRKDISNELIVNQEAIKNLLKGFDSKEFKVNRRINIKSNKTAAFSISTKLGIVAIGNYS